MTTPEAYIHFSPDVFAPDGEVAEESTRAFLSGYMRSSGITSSECSPFFLAAKTTDESVGGSNLDEAPRNECGAVHHGLARFDHAGEAVLGERGT